MLKKKKRKGREKAGGGPALYDRERDCGGYPKSPSSSLLCSRASEGLARSRPTDATDHRVLCCLLTAANFLPGRGRPMGVAMVPQTAVNITNRRRLPEQAIHPLLRSVSLCPREGKASSQADGRRAGSRSETGLSRWDGAAVLAGPATALLLQLHGRLSTSLREGRGKKKTEGRGAEQWGLLAKKVGDVTTARWSAAVLIVEEPASPADLLCSPCCLLQPLPAVARALGDHKLRYALSEQGRRLNPCSHSPIMAHERAISRLPRFFITQTIDGLFCGNGSRTVQ